MSEIESNKFETLPTFYPPDNLHDKEDFEITRKEFEQIKNAFKNEEFRKLLVEYVDDVQDPESQKTYQSEVRQLEKQNGYTVHFLNPVPGYVLKTSVDGQKKGFINICSNPIIRKATVQKATQDSKNGCMWSIPYAQSPVREDVDKAGAYCHVFDVIFNPESLDLAKKNVEFRNKIESIALDAVEGSFKHNLDRNNVKKPKIQYKGMPRATIIKYKTGDAPPSIVDVQAIKNELPPQSIKNNSNNKSKQMNKNSKNHPQPPIISKLEKKLMDNSSPSDNNEFNGNATEPRYSIKYRSHVDLQDCSLDNQKSGQSIKPIPDEVILTIDLPLLSDSSSLDADVLEDGWHFELKSTKKAFYKLNMKLPFKVHLESAKAIFEREKRKLHVTMKTVKKPTPILSKQFSSSEEDDVFDDQEEGKNDKKSLVEEIPSTTVQGSGSDVGYESNESIENIPLPEVINGNIVVKSILKGSSKSNRARSMSESWTEHMDHLNHKDDFMSLESLSESNELLTMSESSGLENKSVRFNDQIQRQLFRSNSSILGQRKKNQKKNKNKRKVRERHNSEGSVSSFDEDMGHEPRAKMEMGGGGGGDQNQKRSPNKKKTPEELE